MNYFFFFFQVLSLNNQNISLPYFAPIKNPMTRYTYIHIMIHKNILYNDMNGYSHDMKKSFKPISEFKKIQSSLETSLKVKFENFCGLLSLTTGNPTYALHLWLRKKVSYRRENTRNNGQYCLIYDVEKLGVLTQTLLGFSE